MYLVDELKNVYLMEKLFGQGARYCTHPKHIKDLCWSLNPNVLLVIQEHNIGFSGLTLNNDQITHNMSDQAIKPQSSYAEGSQQQGKSRNNLNSTHSYYLHPWKAIAPHE